MLGRYLRDKNRQPQALPGPSPTAPEPSQDPSAALALAREVLISLEQFIIATPDLDTARFLRRLRGTAAILTSPEEPSALVLLREWAREALAAFGRLQRQNLAERQAELWRLIELHKQMGGETAGSEQTLLEDVRETHDRIGTLVSLNDVRTLRQELSRELDGARIRLAQKVREDNQRTTALAAQVRRLEHALAEVRGQARYDALTGILHGGTFRDRLREVVAAGLPCTLAVLDVDDFKTINDTLGHPAGDRLLVLVAQELREAARSVDVAARYAGDEFCLLVAGYGPDVVSRRLSHALARRYVSLQVEGRTVSVLLSVTIGIAAFRPGETPEAFFSRADQALLETKRRRKGTIGVAGCSPPAEGRIPRSSRIPAER